jgi:NitT/TauT family transport system permease protein
MTAVGELGVTDAEAAVNEGGGAPPAHSHRSARTRGRRSRRLLIRLALFLVAVALLGVLWVVGSRHFANYILPSPGSVWSAFRSDWQRGVWWSDVHATLAHMFAAYLLTLAIGLPVGILIGRYWVAEDLTRAFLIFLQCVPTIVLIVLTLVFVGPTANGVVIVTVASCFTYFTLNVIQGTKSIDHDLVEMARTYEANEATIMRTIIVPSVVPYFLAGARITLGVAWQVTLFGEYLMGVHGIGFQISGAIGLLQTQEVYAWGLTVVALTIIFEYGFFRPLEHLLTRHTRGLG